MEVEEPRRDDRSCGVDLGLAVGREPRRHLDDAAVAHPDVGREAGAAGAVDHGAAADEEITLVRSHDPVDSTRVLDSRPPLR